MGNEQSEAVDGGEEDGIDFIDDGEPDEVPLPGEDGSKKRKSRKKKRKKKGGLFFRESFFSLPINFY